MKTRRDTLLLIVFFALTLCAVLVIGGFAPPAAQSTDDAAQLMLALDSLLALPPDARPSAEDSDLPLLTLTLAEPVQGTDALPARLTLHDQETACVLLALARPGDDGSYLLQTVHITRKGRVKSLDVQWPVLGSHSAVLLTPQALCAATPGDAHAAVLLCVDSGAQEYVLTLASEKLLP